MSVKYDIILDAERESDINFSFDFIEKKLLIPRNQQMIVQGDILIEANLLLEGQLILEV